MAVETIQASAPNIDDADSTGAFDLGADLLNQPKDPLGDRLRFAGALKEQAGTGGAIDLTNEAEAIEALNNADTHERVRDTLVELKKVELGLAERSPEAINQLLHDTAQAGLDLSAQILPRHLIDKLQIHSSIPDNNGFFHPPDQQEAVMLGMVLTTLLNAKVQGRYTAESSPDLQKSCTQIHNALPYAIGELGYGQPPQAATPTRTLLLGILQTVTNNHQANKTVDFYDLYASSNAAERPPIPLPDNKPWSDIIQVKDLGSDSFRRKVQAERLAKLTKDIGYLSRATSAKDALWGYEGIDISPDPYLGLVSLIDINNRFAPELAADNQTAVQLGEKICEATDKMIKVDNVRRDPNQPARFGDHTPTFRTVLGLVDAITAISLQRPDRAAEFINDLKAAITYCEQQAIQDTKDTRDNHPDHGFFAPVKAALDAYEQTDNQTALAELVAANTQQATIYYEALKPSQKDPDSNVATREHTFTTFSKALNGIVDHVKTRIAVEHQAQDKNTTQPQAVSTRNKPL